MTTTNPCRRQALVLATISLSACAGADEDSDQAAGAPEASTPAPSPSPSPGSGDQVAGTPIRITFGDTELTARLHDNATARELAAQLPLTLTFGEPQQRREDRSASPRAVARRCARRARSRRR